MVSDRAGGGDAVSLVDERERDARERAERDRRRLEAHIDAMARILGSEIEARARVVRYMNAGGPYGEIERLTIANRDLEARATSAERSIHALMTGGEA